MSKKLKIIAASALAVAGLIGATTALSTQGLSTTSSSSTSNSSSSSNKLVDETVYVFAKTDGNVRKIISSDWTKNLDVDEYTNIVSNDKKVPIELKATYSLDGKEISASELAGKSGKVTVRYTYTNTETASGYYVPYAVVSGLMLDNEHFTNVEVKNGKLLNDGSRTIVAGVMLPGMQENLQLSSSTFEIPTYLEFTADAKDFNLSIAFSVATNEIFSDLNFNDIDSLDQLSSQLNKMNDAMDQLIGGSSNLASGIQTLYEKASVLPSGIAQLSAGALQLKSGSSELAAGAAKLDAGVDTVQSGVEQLYTGIKNTTDTYNAMLQNGALQVLESSLATANSNATLRGAMAQYCSIPTSVDSPMTVTNYSTISESCLKPIAAASTDVAKVKEQLDGVYRLYTGIVSYTNGIAQTNENVIKGQLLAGITDTEKGLKAGATALAEGASALASGTTDLSDGLETLNGSAPALVDGIGQLRDGSNTLVSGLKQFNEEAIQKLISVYNNNVKGLINRVKAIQNVAKNNSKNVKYIYRIDEIKK